MNFQARWITTNLAHTPAAQRVSLPLAPSLERRRVQAYLALMAVDAVAIFLGFAFAAWLYYAHVAAPDTVLASQLLLPFYWGLALVFQVYSLTGLVSAAFSRRRAMLALVGGATAILVVAFFTKSSETYSRLAVGLGILLSGVFIVYLRSVMHPLIKQHCGVTGINKLVIDDGGEALRVPHAFHIDAREHGLTPDLARSAHAGPHRAVLDGHGPGDSHLPAGTPRPLGAGVQERQCAGRDCRS